MAKYEAEDFETFVREINNQGVNKVGLKTLYEVVGEKENVKVVRGGIILTASKRQTDTEDFYLYQEVVATDEISTQEKFDAIKNQVNKRMEDMITEFQRLVKRPSLFRGRVLP